MSAKPSSAPAAKRLETPEDVERTRSGRRAAHAPARTGRRRARAHDHGLVQFELERISGSSVSCTMLRYRTSMPLLSCPSHRSTSVKHGTRAYASAPRSSPGALRAPAPARSAARPPRRRLGLGARRPATAAQFTSGTAAGALRALAPTRQLARQPPWTRRARGPSRLYLAPAPPSRGPSTELSLRARATSPNSPASLHGLESSRGPSSSLRPAAPSMQAAPRIRAAPCRRRPHLCLPKPMA